jgi:hypothetical protein
MTSVSLGAHRAATPPTQAGELTVVDMLADPIVRAVMAVDHVRPADVLSLVPALRRRLAGTETN